MLIVTVAPDATFRPLNLLHGGFHRSGHVGSCLSRACDNRERFLWDSQGVEPPAAACVQPPALPQGRVPTYLASILHVIEIDKLLNDFLLQCIQ